MIVLDASVLANVVGDDGPEGHHARGLVAAAGDGAVPDLADVQTVAVLRKRWRAGTIDDGRFEAAIEDLAALPFRRYPTLGLLRRAFELRANVTAYDATYVALAEALACELVTADARLSHAPGLRCHVRTIALASPGSATRSDVAPRREVRDVPRGMRYLLLELPVSHWRPTARA